MHNVWILFPLLAIITSSEQRSVSKANYELLQDGWIGLNNGYQYKRTPNLDRYLQVKAMCNEWGANQVVYGAQSMELRKILKDALNLGGFYAWLGMTLSSNGTWLWENGEIVTDDNAFWYPDYPKGRENYNCATMEPSRHMLSHDGECTWYAFGFCEKAWTRA